VVGLGRIRENSGESSGESVRGFWVRKTECLCAFVTVARSSVSLAKNWSKALAGSKLGARWGTRTSLFDNRSWGMVDGGDVQLGPLLLKVEAVVRKRERGAEPQMQRHYSGRLPKGTDETTRYLQSIVPEPQDRRAKSCEPHLSLQLRR
jgi:hypothetical protein